MRPDFRLKGIFQGGGVGVCILRPHAAGILYAPPFYTPPTPRIGFGKRGLWEKGIFQGVSDHFLEILENLEDSRVPREPPECGNLRPFTRDSRECRDFGDSRDFFSEKTPFVMTPFSGPNRRVFSGVGAWGCIKVWPRIFEYVKEAGIPYAGNAVAAFVQLCCCTIVEVQTA